MLAVDVRKASNLVGHYTKNSPTRVEVLIAKWSKDEFVVNLPSIMYLQIIIKNRCWSKMSSKIHLKNKKHLSVEEGNNLLEGSVLRAHINLDVRLPTFLV